jgi:hypothetical protein
MPSEVQLLGFQNPTLFSCYNRGMTDNSSIADRIRLAAPTLRSIAESLLQSQFKTPTFDALIDVRSQIRPLTDALSSFERRLRPFSDLAARMKQADRLKEAGWIPHPALPVDELVASETDLGKISSRVQLYINGHKEDICQLLTRRFHTYDIQEDTLDMCNAVVQGHRLELFPLIVPSVFSEVERCARDVLGESSRHHGKKIIDNFVSLINDLPISRFDVVQMQILILMEDFIYETIAPGADTSLPHRHGAQHGIIRFNTSQASLNAIFLLDFVLQCCDAIRKS